MNKIKIQGDAASDNPWVKDYITIADCWESVCASNKIAVEGLITPYGINASFTQLAHPSFRIRIRKKLENVRSSDYDLSAWPITQIMHLDFRIKHPDQFDLAIVKNSFYGRLKRFLYKGKLTLSSNNTHLVFSNNQTLILHLEKCGLFDFSAFHSMKADQDVISFFFQFVPSDKNSIAEVIQLANHLAELLPITAIKRPAR